MLQLPVEVQEQILSLLDGESFTKCRTVCKLWKDIHNTVQRRFPIWKRCCLREIPEDVLLHMTYSISVEQLIEVYSNASKRRENMWEIWKSLYSAWYRTRFVGKWIPLETFIQIHNHEDHERYIRCAKILGDHLVVGCQDGHVAFVDSVTGEENEDFPAKVVHNVDVSDVHLMRLESGVDFINNVACYDHAVSSSVWGHVKLTNLKNGFTSMAQVLGLVGSLDSWGHLLKTENNRYGNSQCELMSAVKSENHFTMNHAQTVYHYDAGFTMSQLWKDKFLAGGIDMVSVIDTQKDNEDKYRYALEHIEDIYVEDLVYKAGVALCITENGFLHASIDNGYTWSSTNAMLVVGSRPIRLTLWGTLLAVAFLSGQVNIYHLPEKTDFILGFLGSPCAVIQTDSQICARMDIGDDGEGPMITIVTETGIKVVRWFHPLKE